MCGIDWLIAALALALLAALAAGSAALWHQARRPLLLAPAIGPLSDCLHMAPPQGAMEAACSAPDGSAAQRVELALQSLGPARSPDGHFALGYTLLVPLLNLFAQDASGAWLPDGEAAARIARTVQAVERPVVLYLFSTHFSERAPIEAELAQEAANLAHTQAGPLPVDSFLGQPLYPWSIARTDNAITRRREEAIAALLAPLCALPDAARQRIVGINLLGEVHHLYPNFEGGMGADSRYLISDYSEASREGFRRWLRRRFDTLAALNRHLSGDDGTPFASWGAVQPPAHDIRSQALAHFWQHLDEAAAGELAISGWVHDASAQDAARAPWVRIYVDGVLHARTRANAQRQDVAAALPELGTARVGWHATLAFAHMPRGIHRIDVALEGSGAHAGQLWALGSRRLAVMGQSQAAVHDAPMRAALPAMHSAPAAVRHWIDTPADARAVFFNPLAMLWHEWRGQQVVDYLAHFARLLQGSCLGDVPLRTQQILPAERAGWDGTRFASAASLRAGALAGVEPGVNLYGDAADGAEFFTWLAHSGQRRYSVTEFHPLRAMSAAEMRAALERHRLHGARTLSFFLHTPIYGPDSPNPFSLDPANPRHHSAQLWRAVQDVLAGQSDEED